MMESNDVLARVLELRAAGSGPKQIARALGLRPAQASALLRQAAECRAEGRDPADRPVVGCWVNAGWSAGLGLAAASAWAQADPHATADPATGGFAQVLVARQERASRVTVCGFLVDVYCLGVKNTVEPEVVGAGSLLAYLRRYYSAFDQPPLSIELDQARTIVQGAVAYARSLGFTPAPGFADTAPYLGSVRGDEPAIVFGREGKPFYVSGPYDDARHIVHTLEQSCGTDGFHYTVAMGQV
ncbi:hypothetical protein [Kitasatospora purpeofusca]|uniref:hypothetical protein n=1 Tax=Kitasatospora purpeofusca TaxID=67352 RepID=UPI002250183A|nr:hypothetical protein [Kitasatospora purpeofusca]MCX4757175.1 hypothetical protein [Kitasatospora purpeofusca]WSR35065.1 hypothetical protein OG715_31395 [Kitasatospora purpeofusca]